MRRVLAATAACLAVVLVGACGSSKPTAAGATQSPSPSRSTSLSPSPSPSIVDAGAQCPEGVEGAKPVHFRSGDVQLAGDEWGDGTVGIVFAHESDVDSCSWMGYASAAAKLGYRTLTFDFSGYGGSPNTRTNSLMDDVASATRFLRSEGATKIVLVGASMGGTAVISAAPYIKPPVEAVVALSAPDTFATAYAVDDAAKLTQPLLVMVGESDSRVVPSAKSIYAAATSSKHRQLFIAASDLHGFRLVAPDRSPVAKAVQAMAEFLAKYAPPK